MACACINAGRKEKCAWCKEAEKMGRKPSGHNCQWGTCR
jgi:hypothetical protein